MFVPKILFGCALVKEALLRFLRAISSILNQEYVKQQSCISKTEALRKVHSIKYLHQEGSPQPPQKVYETEFLVQVRSQTGQSGGLGASKKISSAKEALPHS